MNNKLNKAEELFASGNILEAEQLFLTLIEKDQNCKEAYNNLGAISFQRNDPIGAIDYFIKSLEIDPFYKDAIINYAELLNTLDQAHMAVPLLEKILENDPTDKEVSNILAKVRSANKNKSKVAVICPAGMESFLGDIVDFLQTKYEVKTCYSTNIQEVDSTIKWADIVWLEWANELTINLTNHPEDILKDKHTICRLHSYEAFEGFANNINWNNINDLIFVAEHIKNIVVQQVPKLLQIVRGIHVIPNGIDMNKFSFKERAIGKNLAFVGSINHKKGPLLLLHAFRELVKLDREYKLFIAGAFQDTRYQLYFAQMIQEMDLENNIQLDGWIEDINPWLEDKQYIVCTSVLEGHPVGIMEAMARGLKPLIHNFVGAKGIYPDKYLWNTITDFVRITTETSYNPSEYRNFIATNYSLNKQIESIGIIISQLRKKDTTSSHNEDKSLAELEICN